MLKFRCLKHNFQAAFCLFSLKLRFRQPENIFFGEQPLSKQNKVRAELETAEGWISIKDLQSGNSWLGKPLSKRLQKRTAEIFSLAKQKLWHTAKIMVKLGDNICNLFVSKAHPFYSTGKRDPNTGNIIPYPATTIITSGRLKSGDVLLLPHHKDRYQICLFTRPVSIAVRPNEEIGCRHLQTGTHYDSRWQSWEIGQIVSTQTIIIKMA